MSAVCRYRVTLVSPPECQAAVLSRIGKSFKKRFHNLSVTDNIISLVSASYDTDKSTKITSQMIVESVIPRRFRNKDKLKLFGLACYWVNYQTLTYGWWKITDKGKESHVYDMQLADWDVVNRHHVVTSGALAAFTKEHKLGEQ